MDTTQIITQQIAEAVSHNQFSIIELFAAGVLGAALHFLKKARRLKAQAGVHFNMREFFYDESLTILSSLCCIALAIISRENIANLKYGSIVMGGWIYPTFAFIGYAGDSIVDVLFGGYEKKLKQFKKDGKL